MTCQLVFIDTVEVIDNSHDNIPDNRSINPHRRPGGGNYKRNNKTIKEVERLEDIKLKVYFDNKNFTNVGGNLVLPDRAIQTVLFATDLDKIMRAKKSL